jgi:hypothetical protein
MMRFKVSKWPLFWLLLLFSLTVYSYSQIDLNLTLSSFAPYQVWQRRLIRLGYFQRPVSTVFFVGLMFGMGVVSRFLVERVRRGQLGRRELWGLILASVFVLLPSYPAFSHDVFNYLFNARVVSRYHLNPYEVRPLDFPADPWIRFMHWTHRPDVYPPVWLGISLPVTFLTFGKFTPALFLMKLLTAAFFLLTAVLVERLGGKVPLALWAFNPLVVIESLVSAHNDVVMMALALSAVWSIVEGKHILGALLGALSFGVKFVGGFVLVSFGWRRLDWRKRAYFLTGLMTLSVFLVSLRLGFQPWYLIWPLTFAVFLPRYRLVTLVLSVLALLTYAPFLFRGDWGGLAEPARHAYVAILPFLLLVWTLRLPGFSSGEK